MAYILWFVLFVTAFALIVNFFRSLIEFSKTEWRDNVKEASALLILAGLVIIFIAQVIYLMTR